MPGAGKGNKNHATRNHILWGWFPCQGCLLSATPGAAPFHLLSSPGSSPRGPATLQHRFWSGISVQAPHVLFNSTRSCWPKAPFSFRALVLFNPGLCLMMRAGFVPLTTSCSGNRNFSQLQHCCWMTPALRIPRSASQSSGSPQSCAFLSGLFLLCSQSSGSPQGWAFLPGVF